MTALQQVNAFIGRLEARLRWLAALRGIAAVATLSLVLTLVFVLIGNRYQFAEHIVWPLRVLLYVAVASAIALAIVWPLTRLTRRRITQIAERAVPGFEERLLTAAEHPDPSNPFSELVAEDALRVAGENAADELGRSRWRWVFAASAAIAASILAWLIIAGPGYWGYGSSLLWTGSARASAKPLYEVVVQPGNKTIRRKSDQIIKARLVGFSARQVTLRARYINTDKWEEAPMRPAADSGNEYQFLFPNVAGAFEYYVQADASRSKQFRISVKDLPAVKRVRVVLHFPAALNLRDVSEDPGGDVRAVEGTTADIFVLTDRPLDHGVLALDKGQRIGLQKADGNWSRATLPVQQDGSYHVAAIDSGETIRISDDYFIEAKKDEPPTVRIARPGRDPHVSPIEEVPVNVEAADDFGVKSLELHYSVNGGAEQVMRFKSAGQKEEQGHTLLTLENFHLAPGDIVSMYATASDATKTTRSDIIFAQAEAFDYKFSQSQEAGGMGGMGGMGGQEANISERQKQIIAATFNELRADHTSRANLQDRAKFLAGLEGKLGEQAKTLAERMGNRELSQANPEFEKFSKLMTMASNEMNDAVGELTPGKWNDALVPEQKALQSLLRAEALFRDIQVAFGQQGANGGGSGMQRDLARMFDLELDSTKNQYETAQKSQDEAAAEQQKALDDAFERLQMLAQRQQELAQQRSEQQAAEQRWQEEQLRREAEELKRQLQQLAQNSQGSQQQNGSQSGQQNANQNGSQDGQQSASQGGVSGREMTEAMRRSSESLARAEDEMRRAVSNGDRAAQERAAGQLAEAQRDLQAAIHRRAGSNLQQLAQDAHQIAARQRALARRLKQMYGVRGGSEFSNSFGAESGEMPEMNDPDHPGFSYGYRRRSLDRGLRPLHQPTEEERSLAAEKEKLASELDQLQRGMADEEQRLRATAPEASRKLRRALSEAEQKELALRLQKNAQWIREGYGDRNLGMEDNVTAGVEQLSRDLQGAQQSLEASGSNEGRGADQKTAEALSQVRKLREMLEQAQQGSASKQNSQQAAQNGTSSGGATAPTLSPGNPGNLDARELEHAIDQLSHLRGQISGEDRALGNYLGGTLAYLRDLNADRRVLDATIGHDAVSSLERLEAELSRRLGEQQIRGARSAAAETPSREYRDAVAEYFKRLSQAQPK
jgi:hypothetical protein